MSQPVKACKARRRSHFNIENSIEHYSVSATKHVKDPCVQKQETPLLPEGQCQFNQQPLVYQKKLMKELLKQSNYLHQHLPAKSEFQLA